MTRSTLPPNSDVPESTVSELHALYHEAAGSEPGPTLDRSILDAARAELRTDRQTRDATRRQAPWWKAWLAATSGIAVVVVGLSVTWRIMDEQERRMHEEMNAAEDLRDRAVRAAPPEHPADARSAINVQPSAAVKSSRIESTAVQDAPAGVPEPVASPVAAAPAPAAPAAMAPMHAEEAAKKGQRVELDQLRGSRDASAAPGSGSGPAGATGKFEAERRTVGASSAAAADSMAEPATPDAWLKHVRTLQAAGRSVEAAQSLDRFRTRYPDFVLPDDLLNLK
jgi:hypothetical protein